MGSKSLVEPLGGGEVKRNKQREANARAKDPMPVKVEKESKGKCHQREAKQVVKQECTSKQGTLQAGQGAKPDKHKETL